MENKKFFKNVYIATAECLDSKAKGIITDNSGDIGELCEIFIKEFLIDSFTGIARIFRGGEVIDTTGNSSKQVDIVVSPINTLKISADKGIYPIESVYGVFSITRTLDHQKLFSADSARGGCIENLKSVGILKPQFHFIFEGSPITLPDFEFHKNYHPYKCVFGYFGDINSKWADELNEILKKDISQRGLLPDLIIVNKKGYISKKHKNNKEKEVYFEYVDLSSIGHSGSPLIILVHSLLLFLDWQNALRPKYELYFNEDLN